MERQPRSRQSGATMDLTSIFSKKEQWTRGLFLSFDISPASFFESELLPKLLIDDNLTVVIDHANWHRLLYQDEHPPVRAGVHYNLECVHVKNGGRFHPKLYILEQEDRAYLGDDLFEYEDQQRAATTAAAAARAGATLGAVAAAVQQFDESASVVHTF